MISFVTKSVLNCKLQKFHILQSTFHFVAVVFVVENFFITWWKLITIMKFFYFLFFFCKCCSSVFSFSCALLVTYCNKQATNIGNTTQLATLTSLDWHESVVVADVCIDSVCFLQKKTLFAIVCIYFVFSLYLVCGLLYAVP